MLNSTIGSFPTPREKGSIGEFPAAPFEAFTITPSFQVRKVNVTAMKRYSNGSVTATVNDKRTISARRICMDRSGVLDLIAQEAARTAAKVEELQDLQFKQLRAQERIQREIQLGLSDD